MRHEIYVQNVGTVYSGFSEQDAATEFNRFFSLGNSVTWIEDNRISCQAFGRTDSDTTWLN